MVRFLRALGVTLALAHATQALGGINCDRVRNIERKPDTHVVVAYVDTIAGSSEDAANRLRRSVQATVLSNYLDSLGVEVPRAKNLTFIICGRARPVIEPKDVDELMSVNVSLALSRSQQGPNLVFTLAVIPQIYRRKPTYVSDLDVFGADPAASDRSVEGWIETIQVNSGYLKGLLGLALGIDHLDQKDWPMAKLLLCKSRADLHRAGTLFKDSPQSDSDLQSVVGDLLREAERLASASSGLVDANLRQKIKVACEARTE